MTKSISIIKKEIASLIYLIRGKRVMLDSDLAELYGVETKQLNRAVKRNLDRFPEDFMFQLSDQELMNLRCQSGTSKTQRGGRRYVPYAFTEQGVAMLSSVLQSKEAAMINIQIIRAFVAMREVISSHIELARKLEQLEYRLGQHDDEIASMFEAIKQLMAPLPSGKKKRIGF
jgi:phage regulator Rha-like protein